MGARVAGTLSIRTHDVVIVLADKTNDVAT